MPNATDGLAIRISSINICTGGVQIVNIYDGGPSITTRNALPSRLGLLNNGVICYGSDDNRWYVIGQGSQGVGKICRLSITYLDRVENTQKIRARVYQGSTSSTTDPGYDVNSTVEGTRENNGRVWTWTAARNPLHGAAYSPIGAPNYCAFWIVRASDNSLIAFDPPIRPFMGIPSPYGSGSCGVAHSVSEFAAPKELEFRVPDGKLIGDYVLSQVGPMLWQILTGPLRGYVDFIGHGNSLTVRTPFGERMFSIPHERPFAIVIPGDLFGSEQDVVVSAP